LKLNFIKYALAIDKARASFWFVPSLMVLSSILFAACSIVLDIYFIDKIHFSISLIDEMDISAIRSLLGIIAGAMITVTSIVFSITVVTLTLASSQFGPRLLRNFMMDTGTQLVLGSFISNFLFCVLVFCAISFHEPYAFKPALTVIIAILMTCISVGVLIYFIHHVAKSIQADVVIEDVYQDLQHGIEGLLPTIRKGEESFILSPSATRSRSHQINVLSDCSGYVQTLDIEALKALATDEDVFIECNIKPGDFVIQHSVIAIIHADKQINNDKSDKVLNTIELGPYRTPVQDPEFAVHQLVEIALRALSPSINDPYTAITCIDKLNAVLCELTHRKFPDKQYFDETGILRLSNKGLRFEHIANAAFDQIRQQANNNVAVTIRLLESLHELLFFVCNDEQKRFVISQTEMIKEQQNKLSLSANDIAQINNKVLMILSKPI
jgi:uncharacterized membrane protein